MSRRYINTKQEADNLLKINISFLKKLRFLEAGFNAGNIRWLRNGEKIASINLESTINGTNPNIRFLYIKYQNNKTQKQYYDYKVWLSSTACNFGGKRYWFMCPGKHKGPYCGKRVGILFFNNSYFACRHCNNLTYKSRNLSGIFKQIGNIISENEIMNLSQKCKTHYYSGGKTRRYKRLLSKQEKRKNQWRVMERRYNYNLKL